MLKALSALFGLLSFPVLCYSQCSADCFPPIGNLEIGRKITASSQCTSEFCISGNSSKIPCNQHGPSSINNASLGNYWVSQVNIDQPVTLQVDFENPVIFENTVLSWPFHPPDSLILERSSDNGSSWSPYRYFSRQCEIEFNMTEQFDIPDMKFGPDVAICTLPGYSYVPTSDGMVSFSTALHLDGTDAEEEVAYKVITNLRFQLVSPNFLVFNDCEKFFAISQWSINGSCFCNGHADTCFPVPGEQIFPEKVYSGCACQHNTAGRNCESCLTGFNSQPWQPGNETHANQCTACMCNKHADDCYYNETLMSAVCIDCKDNTTGDDCSACLPSFYETSLVPTDPSFCQSCDCNPTGSVSGECDDMTGQCNCKANVHSSLPNLKCTECQNNFFNISETNPLGCTACNCGEGAEETLSCDKTTGQCICRPGNVLGEQCDSCTDGFFKLSEGCTTPCQCNPSGSIGIACDPFNGQCVCKDNITGDLCDRPVEGYFYKPLDDIMFEAEDAHHISFVPLLLLPEESSGLYFSGRGYAEITSTQGLINFTVQVPISSTYELFLRYSSAIDAAEAVFEVYVESLQPVLTRRSVPTNSSMISENLGKFPTPPSSNDYRSFGSLCLESSMEYVVSLSFTSSAADQWLLDSIVLMPDWMTISKYYTSLTTLQAAQIFHCIPYTLPVFHDPLCDALYFILSTEFYGQVFSCDPPSNTGSSFGTCDSFGGSYQCNPGFVGTLCDQCANGFYNYSISGCLECSCNATGSLSAVCDVETGECSCKAGVDGELCDSCLVGHYEFTDNGCSFCNCSEYALSSQCDDTGTCFCPPGITDPRCAACDDGYYNISSSGCQSCDCSAFGSLSPVCDKNSGQCSCQENVVGMKCSTCRTGFIPTNSSLQDTCIPCVCSGQSSQCQADTASFVLDAIKSNFTSLCSLAATDCDDGWRIIYTNPEVTFDLNGPDGLGYVLVSGGSNGKTPQLLAPSKFLGDQRSSYGLTFEARVSVTGGSLFPEGSLYVWLMSSFLSVPLVGAFTTKTEPDPPTVYVTLAIDLVEDKWKVGSIDGSTATFKQFYSALTDLTNLSFSADYTESVAEIIGIQTIQLFFKNTTNGSEGQSDNFITIENCTCSPETTGQFCESCSPGYYRTSSSPVDPCLPCQCNALAEECDVVSGVCLNCTGNSTGDNCQLCKSGFYGNTTQSIGCLLCECPTSDNPLSPTCFLDSDGNHTCDMCLTGYTGRYCQLCDNGYYRHSETNECIPCDCTGNVDPVLGLTCDPVTGECQNCQNHTTGFSCGYCEPGYYGDPLINIACQECQCNINGTISDSDTCDRINGKCFCRPNVAMPFCDECAAGFYGNPSAGGDCQACECPTSVNSHSPTCFLDGDGLPTCDACAPGHTGRNCEICENGYYGDPTLTNGGCNNCTCNGNVDPSLGLTCNMTTGECINCQNHTIGFFCHLCETGYYAISKPGGVIICKECDCTQNGTLPEICDHINGVCFCLPNVAHPSCDQCEDGFYGDPTMGTACKACECPFSGNNSHSATCFLESDGFPTCDACAPGYGGRLCDLCVDGYYGDPTLPGGQCKECECNGNVDPALGPTCNVTTGQCLNCQNYTTGFNCDTCQTGFYGNVSAGDTCKACNCHPNGTSENVCDDATGECFCIDFTTGSDCSQCEPGYWGLSKGFGCIECDCCTNGTLNSSPVCNQDTGHCNCLGGIAGPDCCDCSFGYFNYSSSGCQDCDCGELAEEQCDITGQCICKPGGTGFKCDECDFGFSGKAPNCTACHQCFFPWYAVLEGLQNNVTFYLNRIEDVLKFYDGYDEQQIKDLIADLYKNLNYTKALTNGISLNDTTLQNIQLKLNMVSNSYSTLLSEITIIQQSLNDSEMILNLIETFIDMVDNTQYMGINYSDVHNILTELNSTIKGLFKNATDAYSQLMQHQATVASLAYNITTFQLQAMVYLDSLNYASNTSQEATDLVLTVHSLMPDLVLVDIDFTHIDTDLLLVQNGTAIANASYAELVFKFAELNMSIQTLGDMLSNASTVVAALHTDATNALEMASSNLLMVEQLMNDAMYALSKAESLVSLISNASSDAEQGSLQLEQAHSNAEMLQSHPTLPTDKADELAQNLSMISLTEEDIEKILNDTDIYENATKALGEAMEAFGIANSTSDSLKSMQMFINSLCLALNSSEANIQQVIATLQAIDVLSAEADKKLMDINDRMENITNIAKQAETVTADTYSTINDAIAEALIQESVAADSSNKSMITRSSVESEEKKLSSTESSLTMIEAHVNATVSNASAAASTAKDAQQDAEQLKSDSKTVSIEDLDDLLADYVSKLQEISSVKKEIISMQQKAKDLTDALEAAATKYKNCYKTP